MSDRIVELDYRYDEECISQNKIQKEKTANGGDEDLCIISDAPNF
jgi:hypothetical protein